MLAMTVDKGGISVFKKLLETPHDAEQCRDVRWQWRESLVQGQSALSFDLSKFLLYPCSMFDTMAMIFKFEERERTRRYLRVLGTFGTET